MSSSKGLAAKSEGLSVDALKTPEDKPLHETDILFISEQTIEIKCLVTNTIITGNKKYLYDRLDNLCNGIHTIGISIVIK